MISLWPKDMTYDPDGTSPLSILVEQANLLGEMTQHNVEAAVDILDLRAADNKFNYLFSIVAPTLGGYRYGLFSIAHDITYYPLVLRLDEDIARELGLPEHEGTTLGSEQEFVSIVEAIFSSQKTRLIIQRIWSMANSAAEKDEGYLPEVLSA